MAVFSFTHAQYLFLLFLIPFFFMIHFFSLQNRKKVALRFANFDAISRIRGIDFFSKNIVILFLNLLIILLLILSISGLSVQVTKKASSFSFVIAVDTSESMLADDFSPNRITAAKEIAKDFIDLIPQGGRIGVVSFSGNAYIEQDMSDDKIEIKNSINRIETNAWGGTDLYEAVITSSNILKEEENKAVILLSDGQINTPYAISKLDKDSLSALSYNTGAKSFLAENREELLNSFSEVLDVTERKVNIKMANYLTLLVIFLFSFEVFLLNTRYLNIL